MNQKKLVLRMSGFQFYLFLTLGLVFSILVLFEVKKILQTGLTVESVFAILVGGFLALLCFRLIAGQKIELTENQLTLCHTFSKSKLVLFPKIHTKRIDIQNIGIVAIGRIPYFEKHVEEFKDENLQEFIEALRNLILVVPSGSNHIPIPIPAGGVVARYVPLLSIVPKNSSQEGMAITLKPFSKRGVSKLIKELRERNVKVIIEPGLGL